jgi:hypothetical protein
LHKSFSMMELCLAEGWKAEVKTNFTGAFIAEGVPVLLYKLYAMRQQETLVVEYHDSKLIRGDYTYGSSYKLKLNWKNQIVKLVTGKPDPKHLAGSADLEDGKYVPWTPESTEDEILRAVRGCTVTWVRQLDGELLSAQVPAHRTLKISTTKAGKRNLEWADPFGFHAVRLDSIVQVS